MKNNLIHKHLERFLNLSKNSKSKNYSLLDDAFSNEDIIAGIDVLLSKKITMGEITYNFEKQFAKYIGTKYALMTNSGSSANLLAAFSLVNPKKENFLKHGDEFIIQSLCWSTSLWPLVQAGLKPKFVDVDIDSFNINYENLKKNISKKTKALMVVHVLGNSPKIDLISKLCKEKNLFN